MPSNAGLAEDARGDVSPAHATGPSSLLQEALEGLRSEQPTLPAKLFYDEAGSRIYDEITALEEYYPYAAEVDVLTSHGPDIARAVGPGRFVVEYGAGSSVKTRLLLDALHDCAGIVLVDISGEHLEAAAAGLARRYPGLPVEPVCADFSQPLELPERAARAADRVAFFPGSTIGNFDPPDAVALLAGIRELVGSGGHLLVGVDIPKDRATLELAYDDPSGVTARFNLNMLTHVNRLFDGDFDVASFEHEARWNEAQSRIEMHLRCRRNLQVTVGGERFAFAGEQTIRTECSYKFSPEVFRALGREAGFEPVTAWFDAARRYTVHLLRAGRARARAGG